MCHKALRYFEFFRYAPSGGAQSPPPINLNLVDAAARRIPTSGCDVQIGSRVSGSQFKPTLGSLQTVLLAACWALLCAPHSTAGASELQYTSEVSKPDFSLHDLNGKNVPLKTFKGRTVLVHFFATWCEPCREELPALNRFLIRASPNVSVIAISVAEVDPRVRRFFDQMPVDFPVLLDRDRAVAKSWNISALPTTYVLDADMKPAFLVEADFAWDTVDIDPVTGKLVAGKSGEPTTTSEQPSTRKRGDDHEL